MTAPYYSDELVTLYHGLAEDHVAEWTAADVLCVDPPYGIDYQSGQKSETIARSIAGDKDTSVRDAILEAWGPDRAALVFGTWRIVRPAGVKMLLVWDKKGALGMGDLSIPWKPGHEEIYVLGGGAWRGQRTNDVLRVAPVQSTSRNGRLHPHQKPLALMEELIRKLPLGVVADPTAGVGSTLLAASRLGQRSIGVELDEGHCETIAKRCATDRSQALFGDWDGAA
ncbi:DNA methyltransferase [Clavibacter sp. VKM Ac-2872]|uniref:DNA methyltransferase n=1 Tax=Clavibacter sp. VKM Ac-2872 TaxID=2783812 RepID=UPI001889FE14|nr:DNA methyltransferase [Clavibacter sp. VKM Ac-2872]MBF4625519.1 site-specific DNA-methyltransferase [Clavibacter sp. VKM Ac-2872]